MSADRRRRRLQASGPDAFGRRRVLPAMTGQAFLPAGTCPGCGAESHFGRTCRGWTTDRVIAYLRRLPGTVYVPLERR